MKKLTLISLAVAAALAISPAVLLGQSENFTINIDNNGIELIGSGTISTAQTYLNVGGGTATDGYLVTSFTGTLNVTGAPANGTVTFVPSTNDGGNFIVDGVIQADDLLFPANDVNGTASGYLDNSGLVVGVGGYYANIFTGSSIYPGAAGLPYWVYYSGGFNIPTVPTPTDPLVSSVSVPEYGSLSMLLLSIAGLAGGFFFKTRNSGLLLNA
jgi:hypothetical protein